MSTRREILKGLIGLAALPIAQGLPPAAPEQSLVVVDVFMRNGQGPAVVEWCKANGWDPKKSYRAEANLDARTVTVFEYAFDANGKPLVDWDKGETIKRQPYTIPLKLLPPPGVGIIIDKPA
jgi:hypothetical protein